MNKQYIIFLFSLLLIGLMGCRKDSDVIIDTPDNPLPQIEFDAVVQGIITDRQGQPLGQVQVTFGPQSVETDAKGAFLISHTIQGQRGILHLRKPGYFDLQKAVMASKVGLARTFIQLTERGDAPRISSSQGGAIEISGGGRVEFAPNSFEDEFGNAYTGEVAVYSYYIDPTDPKVEQFVPGDLSGFDSEDNLRGLQSFGMVKVELEGDAGQRLQINQAATLEIPVPDALQWQAPSAIPLWYFDEALGFWKEEGEAMLQGDFYIGQVRHFSFWNCDIPIETVFFEATIRTPSNSGLPTTVRMTQLSNGDQRTTHSSIDGYFSGLVPANEELRLDIFDNCGGLLHTENIAPMSSDPILRIITVDGNLSFFSADIVSCTAGPLSKPYLTIDIPGSQEQLLLFANERGRVAGTIATCGASELTIRAYDLIGQLQSNPQTLAVTPVIDPGFLSTCNGVTEIVTLEFDGRRHDMVYFGSFTPDELLLTGQPAGTTKSFSHEVVDQISLNSSADYGIDIDIMKEPGNTGQVYIFNGLNLREYSADAITYSVEAVMSGGQLIENGLDTGDEVQLRWENVIVKEGIGGNFTNEYPGGAITLTFVLR
ncbi:MAG: hypothetical protein AAGG75_04885 [Bacteroidota bacterium]